MKKYFLTTKKEGGYMLVEIMVSLSIFAIVAVSSTAALLAIIDANTKSQNTKAVMDNLSVAIENISRSVRIGTDYKCINVHLDPGASNLSSNCQSGKKGISFLPQDAQDSSDRVEYYFEEDNVNNTGIIYRNRKDASNNYVKTALTAPEVIIKKVEFRIIGASTNDGQPRVQIIINGEAGLGNQTPTKFNVQTTVVQRQLDNS